MSTIRRNEFGKDLDLRAEASRRYRTRQAEQRTWLSEIATHLDCEPQQLLTHSAATVADLIRTQHQQ